MDSWCFFLWCLTQITTHGSVGQKVIIHIMGDMYVISSNLYRLWLIPAFVHIGITSLHVSRVMSATGVYKVLDNLVLTIVALWFVLV